MADSTDEKQTGSTLTGDRVVVKPDEYGGFTVEKFGASTYFSAEQWRNFNIAVENLEEIETPYRPESPQPETERSTSNARKASK